MTWLRGVELLGPCQEPRDMVSCGFAAGAPPLRGGAAVTAAGGGRGDPRNRIPWGEGLHQTLQTTQLPRTSLTNGRCTRPAGWW